MRAIRIDMDGVTEVDVPDDFLDASDNDWDYFEFDAKHDIWVEDIGLFADNLELARVGPNGTVPLPAYVFGIAGEKTVGASLSVEDVEAQVSWRRGGSQLTFKVSSSTD